MSFGDLPLLTTDVPYGKTKFSVRGISTEDVARILPRFGPDIVVLMGGVLAGQRVDSDTLPAMARTLVAEAPDLVTEIIARAADDPSERGLAVARRLPLPVQIEALTAIYNNTFTSQAELKKFVGAITAVVVQTTNLVEAVAPDVLSETGIGVSVAE